MCAVPCAGQVQNGAGLKPGYTSHVADAKGSEVVIFDEAAMLPLYVVNMKDADRHRHAGVMAAAMGAAAGGAGGAGGAAVTGEQLKGISSTGNVPTPFQGMPAASAPLLPGGTTFGGMMAAAFGGRGHVLGHGPGHGKGGKGGRGAGGRGHSATAIGSSQPDDEEDLRRALERSKTDF